MRARFLTLLAIAMMVAACGSSPSGGPGQSSPGAQPSPTSHTIMLP
ncbi:MAG: hypothetical protein ACR2MY_13210 [Candidatus Dormibacteria bacterium]